MENSSFRALRAYEVARLRPSCLNQVAVLKILKRPKVGDYTSLRWPDRAIPNGPMHRAKALHVFCGRLVQLHAHDARAALQIYFHQMLDAMSAQEICEVKFTMLEETDAGFHRDVFAAALDAYLATREERN